jgi:hypothetical protein
LHPRLFAGLACLVTATSVIADDAVPNFAEDTLTGDWGGARSSGGEEAAS